MVKATIVYNRKKVNEEKKDKSKTSTKEQT